MGRFGEADSVPPLYVVELAHEIRAALNDPKVRQKAASEAHAALERGVELGRCEQWYRTLAKDWPFPTDYGVDEPPGCILALVALNDFAASKPEFFHRHSAEFTPVADSWSHMFYWSWRQMVDDLKPEHEAKIKSVVASALRHLGSAPDAIDPTPAKIKPKRSTNNGDARSKIIAGLTNHHQYENGSCLNFEPVRGNVLAKQIGVAKSSVSDFFKAEFDGHAQYRVQCHERTKLITALQMLNGEHKPKLLNRNLGDADAQIDARR